jgi:two-component system, LytTR family, response regulator
MQRIRTVVVEDEPIARERLLALLASEADVDVVGDSDSGRAALELIDRTAPDLVFLDVQLPELDGVEVARSLTRAPAPAFIFVTAFEAYALPAFEIHALDYLLKPFSADRFRAALAHVRAQLARRQTGAPGRHVRSLGASTPGAEARDRLIVKSAGRIHFLRTADIDWCESAGNYVRLHVGSASYLVRETMARLEAGLDPARFVRIHRCTIVNVERIQEMRAASGGDYVVVLANGRELALSRGCREALQSLMTPLP